MVIKSEGYSYALFATPTNKIIIKELEAKGVKVFIFPPFETEKTELNAEQSKLIESIADFDWIIFPDVSAVDYLIETLEEKGVDLFELDLLRVLAFGEAVADRLRFSELHADIIVGSTDQEKVFKVLLDYLTEEDPARLTFLVLRAETDKFVLVGKLSEIKANVAELPIYRISSKKEGKFPKIKALMTGGAIDEFIFSDPLDLLSLKNHFSGSELGDILSDVKISATNQVTFTALEESGLTGTIFRP